MKTRKVYTRDPLKVQFAGRVAVLPVSRIYLHRPPRYPEDGLKGLRYVAHILSG
jgi:hypothetical protein